MWLRDGSPIAGQTASTYVVQAADRGRSLACQVTATVGAGTYSIAGLPSGSYNVMFRANSLEGLGAVGNYVTTYFQQVFAHSQAGLVTVTAGTSTSGIDAEMPSGGEITGEVLDGTTHMGVAGVKVCAEAETHREGCALTNAAGEYALVGLPTAHYVLLFSFEPKRYAGDETWSEYYGGAATASESEPVAVSAGGVTSGIDAEMYTGQISGTVIGAAGKAALAGIEVCATPRGFGFPRGCTHTNAVGEYEIGQLGPGSYYVQFSPIGAYDGDYVSEFYPGAATASAATKVTVIAERTSAGIDAELQTGGEVVGTVRSASTHMPLDAASVCAELTSSFESGPCVSTDAAGEYTIEGLATGSYKIAFSTGWEGQNSDYLESYFDDETSREEATPVSVSAGSTVSKVDDELQMGGQVLGRVTAAATGNGVSNASVCTVGTAGVGAGLPIRCVKTNASGEYTLSGVPGGAAVMSFEPELGGGNYLGQLYSGVLSLSFATSVPVAPGASTEGIDAQLRAGGEITGRVTSSAGTGIAGVTVCAEYTGDYDEAFLYQADHGTGECAVSAGPGGSSVATSNQLTIPAAATTATEGGTTAESAFKLLEARYDARTGRLDFLLALPAAGRLAWKLFFQHGRFVGSPVSLAREHAEIATRADRRHGRCVQGKGGHGKRCLTSLTLLASGGRAVKGGTVEVEVRPDRTARDLLRAGDALHVSGSFELQPSTGGSDTRSVTMTARRVREHKP